MHGRFLLGEECGAELSYSFLLRSGQPQVPLPGNKGPQRQILDSFLDYHFLPTCHNLTKTKMTSPNIHHLSHQD